MQTKSPSNKDQDYISLNDARNSTKKAIITSHMIQALNDRMNG